MEKIRKRLLLGIGIPILGLLCYHSAMAQTEPRLPFKFIREIGGIREYELTSNGLCVLLLEDRTAPVATVMVTYRVGSRFENDTSRGDTHLLEHMMFKGTARHQKAAGTAIPYQLQQSGAILNASTWQDGTNYFETLPIEKLDLALDIEADRMRNSMLKAEDLQSEMPVVLSEFDHIENSPLMALENAVWSTAFTVHPYHYHVIGIREDVKKTSTAMLKNFYDSFYWPNNAVLTVIGDFKHEDVLKKIEKYFGTVPRSPKPIPSPSAAEPEQKEKRFVQIERQDKIESVLLAYRCPAATHPDAAALDILATVASHGKTSRLYRALIDPGYAIMLKSEPSMTHDPGLFMTEVMLSPATRPEDAENIVLQVFDEFKNGRITSQELQRARNQLHAQIAYSRDGSFSVASQLNATIIAGDWTLYSNYMDAIDRVTLQDLERVAKTYFVPGKLTVGYLVSPELKTEKKPLPPQAVNQAASEEPQKEIPSGPAPTAGKASGTYRPERDNQRKLSDRIQVSKADGIKVETIQTGVHDMVVLMGSFRGAGESFARNPMKALLTAALLDEGTTQHNKFEIARLLEDRGAEISFDLDYERVGFKARCLKGDVPLVIGLIAEQLRFPLFDAKEFELEKTQHEVKIHYAMGDTEAQAEASLSRAIYAPTHPNYEPAFEKQLKELRATTLEDVRSFHARHYGPWNMLIVAAGDIDEQTVVESVAKSFKGWKKKKPKPHYTGKISLNRKTEREVLNVPDKVKIDVFWGHGIPLTRKSKNYLPAFVANAVLGGDFSSRLNNTVRDRDGLTYAVFSELNGFDKDIEGSWQINIILNTRDLEQGIKATQDEIERFVKGGITARELEDKKSTLTGRFKVGLATTWGLSERILHNEELGFGRDYLDRYPGLIRSIKLRKTNRVIKRYFHPDKLNVSIAGSFEHEKPR
ncbi:MAG: pitrilysin family protein [Candidatus Omnitrophica bacterium]|nr:pitrilysin family protein [Candidatus Omnitrophota bacterium]MDD5671757.1 pitrilysin family protein [Candidatus Omnitrophota bacterium]